MFRTTWASYAVLISGNDEWRIGIDPCFANLTQSQRRSVLCRMKLNERHHPSWQLLSTSIYMFPKRVCLLVKLPFIKKIRSFSSHGQPWFRSKSCARTNCDRLNWIYSETRHEIFITITFVWLKTQFLVIRWPLLWRWCRSTIWTLLQTSSYRSNVSLHLRFNFQSIL